MNIEDKVKWDEFMSRHDMIWNEAPYIWYDAPFLGNGFMGVSVVLNKNNNGLIINLGHNGVFDNRENIDFETDNVINTARLPVGKISVSFTGKAKIVNMRLSLYNAMLYGDIVTTKGRISFNCTVLNDVDCLVFEHSEFGNERINFEYIKSHAMSPREYSIYDKGKNISKNNYDTPRASTQSEKNSTYIFVQPYYNGGGFSVATKEKNNLYIVSLCHGKDEDLLTDKNLEIINYVLNNLDNLIKSSLDLWHRFYRKSFVSICDGKYESFVYIQLYKLACAARKDSMPFDTCGPWLTEDTRWPGCWWNLNVELTASPLYISNHTDIAHCITNALKNGKKELMNNVPKKYRTDCAGVGRSTTSDMYSPITIPGDMEKDSCCREAGNLCWGLYCCYCEYKMTGDKTILVETVYPLLKRAVQFYLYFLYKDKDGKLHLKSTLSPEYPITNSDDANYDLSLLKWGCKTLIEICDVLKIEDCKKTEWENVINNLTDYPHSNDEGLYIARDIHYAESHRHYSHMLMFYPLHNIDINDVSQRKLIEKSINFWQSKPESLQGYSQSGAASMRAMLGDGNKALYHLEKLFKDFIHPNTMYDEGENPVLETPPSAAASILEMLVQSHEGYINIFPAVPTQWKNICFNGLLCEGAFEVGARLNNGIVEWIKIKSLCGNKCLVKAEFKTDRLFSNTVIEKDENGLFILTIEKGEEVTISAVENAECIPVSIKKKTENCYGLNKRNRRIRNVKS